MTGALLTLSEVAEVLGRSLDFVRALVADGELEGRKLRGRWYVTRPALEQWLGQPRRAASVIAMPSRRVLGRQDAQR